MPEVNPEVTIVGGGMAGLAAALRLAQRKYRVTLLEQDDFLGGKWGAHADARAGAGRGRRAQKQKPVYHEHSYHMFLNWFHNFWAITEELGLRDQFMPWSLLRFLRPGAYPRTTELRDVGSPWTLMYNLFSGVLPVADSVIYNYSLVDLLSQPVRRGNFLDQYSVNAFMHSRPYSTSRAALQHQRTLAKAFACPSYLTSAATYQNFIKYGFWNPEPMVWILKGNCQEHFHAHLEKRLRELGVSIHFKRRVEKLHLEKGRAARLDVAHMSRSPTVHADAEVESRSTVKVGDYLILAVPPKALGRLVDEHVYAVAPALADVRKLRSEPMASLDLYFKRKLPAVPAGHVVLLGSKYDLTFIDNSHVWPGETCTNLNVVASEFDTLNFDDVAGASKPADARLTEAQAMHYILEELRRYVPFDDADIDHDKTHIQTNTGEALFVNEVGSWSYRPGTRCSIPNLFLAGDFCRSVIDVVTVEAAVVTGLMAAEALRSEAGQGTPIRVVEPRSYPESAMAMLTLMGAPYAYAAKMWASWCQESRSALGRVLPPAGPGDS